MSAAPGRPWYPEFILLAALWGSSFLFTRLAVVEFGATAAKRHPETIGDPLRSSGLVVGFEEGVALEHLLDFLVQLQRGQLQQADGLLQLGRQRQVLRKPNLE